MTEEAKLYHDRSKELIRYIYETQMGKKVFAALHQQGIEAYCPLNKVIRQWNDQKKTVEIPLFTSYVFVHVAQREQQQVRMTPGMVNFVYWLGRIASIRHEQMAALQDFVNTYNDIRVEALSYYKSDLIEIASGALRGQQAIVEEVRKNKLELILKSMNVKLVVDYQSATANTGLSAG